LGQVLILLVYSTTTSKILVDLQNIYQKYLDAPFVESEEKSIWQKL